MSDHLSSLSPVALFAGRRESSERHAGEPSSSSRRRQGCCWLLATFLGSTTVLFGCSTTLVNDNTFDVSTTAEDLTTRQIVFNLVRTRENQFTLPSQVQIPQGSVAATSSISPTITTPITPTIATTVAATNTSLSNTNAVTRSGFSPTVTGTASNTDSWTVDLLQDPEQLRRLRLLYQYGAGQINAADLTCKYPIPEKASEKQQTASQPSSSSTQPNAKKRRYVRVVGKPGSIEAYIGCRHPNVVLVGEDPDPAFLNFPDCIICAFPNTNFDQPFRQYAKGHRPKIFIDDFVPETEAFNDNYEYVPVVLNNRLAPNATLVANASNEDYRKNIDWLSVVKNGTESIPEDARRIGSWDGYSVFSYPVSVQITGELTGDEHFSEFILAVMEAILQPAELQKVGATPPPVVQTQPR
jgi:hypothetical protein